MHGWLLHNYHLVCIVHKVNGPDGWYMLCALFDVQVGQWTGWLCALFDVMDWMNTRCLVQIM